MPHSRVIHATTCRVVRARVLPIQAFGSPCRSAVSRKMPPPWPNPVRPLIPSFWYKLMPSADRAVVEKQPPRHRRATHPVVQRRQSIRPTGRTVRDGAVASQFDQVGGGCRVEEAWADHANSRITPQWIDKDRMRIPDQSGHISQRYRHATDLIGRSGGIRTHDPQSPRLGFARDTI